MSNRWQHDTPVDFLDIQDVSDDGQDRAIMCLMQLHQRLLVAAPIDLISGAAARPMHPPSGKPQGFIEDRALRDPAPQKQINQPLGNYVEISGGLDFSDTEERPRGRFITGFHKKHSDERETRASNMGRSVGQVVPPYAQTQNRDYNEEREENFYKAHGHDHCREPSPQDYYRKPEYEPDQPPTPRAQRHQDKPCGDLPFDPIDRYSTVSSLSSLGSGEQDHPEYNPWASGDGAISPISNIAVEIAAGNPYRNPLVPDALEPRRNRDSQYTFNSRSTSATLSMPPEMTPQGRIGSFGSVSGDKLHKPWVTDMDSVYSGDSMSNANYPSYYRSQSPNDNTRHNNIIASRIDKYGHHDTWDEEDRVQTRSPPNPSYTWMPPKPKVRAIDRSSPTIMQFPTPPRPSPPSEHERPFARSPPTSVPLLHTERIVPLHEGPPPTAPPNKPIPVPVPRVPERAPNRPRGLSNVSGSHSTSNNSPITPITPPTPATPRSVELSNGYMLLKPLSVPAPAPAPAPAPLTRRESTNTTSTNSQSIRSSRPVPPLRIIPPITSGSAKAFLPSEANKYAGFCKGAWRHQIGDTKKTWEERSRPAGIYAKMNSYIKCKKCHFEGRAIKVPDQKKAGVDTKVYGSNGILYRWEFLFKSHLHVNKANTNTLESQYGCMFCCAMGKGTPVFGGVAALLAHLQEHREVLPVGEIVYRMHAVVGTSPDPEEDFHVALPSLVI